MEYHGKKRVYQSPLGASESFDTIVPDAVTTNPGKFYQPYLLSHQTIFKEVDIVPYSEELAVTEFLSSLKPKEESLEYIFESIIYSIEEQWDPNKFHLIGASSGWDSRVIAKAIQILAERNGREWLGRYLFVENGGEGDGFINIMQTLGFIDFYSWEPKYHSGYFLDIHNKFNGIAGYPVNQWYDFYINNYASSLHSAQYITGYGANEVTEAVRLKSKYIKGLKKNVPASERLRQYFKWHYYHQLAIFRECTDTIYPFWNFKFIRAMAGNDKYGVRLSEMLARKFVPECNHIPKLVTKNVRAAGHRTISKDVLDELYKDYTLTEWGKKNPVVPSADINYNNWWMNYCAASYTQAKGINLL